MDNMIFSIFPSENFVDLGLYQFGWEHCEPAHSFGPAARNHYLFHYVISGSGQLMADDSRSQSHTYTIRTGQGFMIFPGQVNTYMASLDTPWEYIWLEFDGLRVKESLMTTGLSPDHPVYRAHDRNLQEDMRQEMAYIVQNREATPFHQIGHLYLFLDYLTRSLAPLAPIYTQQDRGRLRDFYIREAISYVESNFQNDISVESIASSLGLNRSYFGKIFKDVTGKAPQEFILNYRMVKATELLRLTDLPVMDIAAAVGYPNPLHFSRAFKNIYGVSPRAWRGQMPRAGN